jgi:ABC-type transport system substrate-binding protein
MHVFILALLAVILVALGAAPAASQDGRGLVKFIADGIPLSLQDHVTPRLYHLDPVTGALEGAAPDNFALVVDATPTAEGEQTLMLRNDLLWSDGLAVNAYDVAYSLITDSQSSSRITALALVDDSTVMLGYAAPDCSNAARSNIYVRTFRSTFPEFEAFAREFSAQNPELTPITQWREALADARLQFEVPQEAFYLNGGLQILKPERPGENARLLNDGFAMLLLANRSGITSTQRFLIGDTNLLIAPPFDRRADLLTSDDVQVYNAPGWSTDYLVFNVADTRIPRSAFTTKGELLDQGQNRFFNDKRLRQAVRLAIDVESIIEVVFAGQATPLAGTLPLVSWGHNPALHSPSYDPGAAERLLDEAGWVDTDGDGIRNCYRCTSASVGTTLFLDFVVDPSSERSRAADMITGQLRRVGIGASPAGSEPASQRFDLYLGSIDSRSDYALDPDQSALFTRAGDVLGEAGNMGSYHNPALEELLTRARTVPGCDVAERAALYQQAQTLLADDLPMWALYSRYDMYLARGIEGFAPQPGNPFWNLMNWRVTS